MTPVLPRASAPGARIVYRRNFFSFPAADPEVQTFNIKRVLSYPPDLMYDVVADVQYYSTFLPYCKESKVIAVDGATAKPSRALLQVGYKAFEESFESDLECTEDSVIAQSDNRLFHTLYTKWTIKPLDKQRNKCLVDFNLQYAFNNPVYNSVSKTFGPTLADIMVKAFQKRAQQLSEGMESL